jgi:DNA transposition AAA+ family ATPase
MTITEFKEMMGKWRTAKTQTFMYITEQLQMCQQNSIAGLFCDAADIGKTYAALHYASTNKNVIYIDASQVKSRQRFIRTMAQEFGVSTTGKYSEVYARLVEHIKSIDQPMCIIDEGGDLSYEAFLELKALWNATERKCGWYMLGADGLKEKINRSIDHKKVGYTEIFSRYGKRFQSTTPAGQEESKDFQRIQAALIIKANAPAGIDVEKMIRNTSGSLRRINNELCK